MATYESIMSELNEMRNHFDGGFSSTERDKIAAYTKAYLNKEVNRVCGDCYRDAFLELRVFLSKLGKLPEPRNYKLRQGQYLHIFGSYEYIVEPTDEQAERFLSQFPGAIERFEAYPSDWKERVAKRKESIYRAKQAKAKREAKKAAKQEVDQDEK